MNCHQLGGKCINEEYPRCEICCRYVTHQENLMEQKWKETEKIHPERIKEIRDGLLVLCLVDISEPDGEQSRPLFDKGKIYLIRSYGGMDYRIVGDNATHKIPGINSKNMTWEIFDKRFQIVKSFEGKNRMRHLTCYGSGKLNCWQGNTECLSLKKDYTGCEQCLRFDLINHDEDGFWVDTKKLDELCSQK